jgi:hypothetical protein
MCFTEMVQCIFLCAEFCQFIVTIQLGNKKVCRSEHLTSYYINKNFPLKISRLFLKDKGPAFYCLIPGHKSLVIARLF